MGKLLRLPLLFLLFSSTNGEGIMSFVSSFLGSGLEGGQGQAAAPSFTDPASIAKTIIPMFTGGGSPPGGVGGGFPFQPLVSMFTGGITDRGSERTISTESDKLSSVVDYDDQVVYSRRKLAGVRSKGSRKWKPFVKTKPQPSWLGGPSAPSPPAPYIPPSRGPPTFSRPPKTSEITAPKVKTPSSFADYDDYDSNLDPAPIIAATPPPTFRPTYPPTYPPTWYSQYRPTYPPTWPPQYRPVYPPTYPPANSRSWNARPPPPPPPERFRPVRRTISAPQTNQERNFQHAVKISSQHHHSHKNAIDVPHPRTNGHYHQVSNMVSEITSLSTIHQTRDNDYQSVEKIMHAFSNALSDPKKPKREILDDATEVGRNRALANHLFESDIVLTVPQMKGIVMAEKEQIEAVYRGRVKRKVITGLVYRWPKGKPIPYRFKEQDASWRKQIREAIGMWEKETCVRFQENYGAFDHVIFYKGSGCFSGIGKTGGSQMISIGYGCDNVGIIAHEIGHTLGFWHEQSRPDRDYYINIRREYIAAGAEANFLRQTLLETDNMGLPYDMGSVMHYGPEAFSTRAGQITIATNDPRFENTIGQRNSPSFIDIKQINRLYCNDACVGMQLACRHGGYPDPNNCQLCKCPPGLTGSICNDVEAGSCGGSDLTAATGWQEINHTGKGDCAWRIKTKNGKIRMRLSGSKYSCESTCNAYVEIKAGSDFQQTGFRVCCEDKIVEVVSESEEVLIISHGAGLRRESGFRLQYIKANAHSEVVPGSEVKPQPAPSIKWTPGQENRHFRGVENVPIEQFILNAIPHIRDPAHPEASIASMVADYALSGIFSIGKK